jgi:anti-sigma factor RsiW
MTCRELVERVTDYLEGKLPAPDVEELTRHLQQCDGCAEYVHQIRSTVHVAGAIRLDAPDREALRRNFRSRNQT